MLSARPLSLEDVTRELHAHDWRFAKTMPHIPHWYTLRKNWSGAVDWETLVQYIRDHGFRMRWGKSNNLTYIDIDGMRYWTMGAPLAATILINREEVKDPAPYDLIAPKYDAIHRSIEARIEDIRVMRQIAYRGGDVLDIGCGTGLFLDHVQPDNYVGVDPSAQMLLALKQKHPGVTVQRSKFEDYTVRSKFDLIVALYGSASYVTAEALQRIPKMLRPVGRYFLMFYDEGYTPVTYERTGVHVDHFEHARDILPGKVSKIGNFWVLESE